LYDLLDLSSALFCGAFIAGAEELVGSFRDGRREDGIEGEY
jgi:hypothetical protein